MNGGRGDAYREGMAEHWRDAFADAEAEAARIAGTTTIVLRRRILSANAFTNGRGFGKSRAFSVDRDAWMMLLRVWITPRARPPKCHTRVEVHSFRNRLLDDANLRGGAKGLIDNLKRLGLIYDDAPKFFVADYTQHQVPRTEERTVLIIHPSTPIPEEPCKSRRTK